LLPKIQDRLLQHFIPPETTTPPAYQNKSKLKTLFGERLLQQVHDKVVIDFGCGGGEHSLELARFCKRVIGLEIVDRYIESAREQARQLGITNVQFCRQATEQADVILSMDAFEHFSDLAGILEQMYDLLKPGGFVLASFGPTWFHPYGGHLFSVFPWAHLIFSEEALIRWRSRFRQDGARRFSDVEGGLNGLTLGTFEKIVHASRFRDYQIETVPIRRLRPLHNGWTREFTTAIVRCKLLK
jgi:SAM-dependent methyltransferase